MKSLSLKSRFLVFWTILVLLVVSVLCAVAYNELEEAVFRNVDISLASKANGLLAALEAQGNDVAVLKRQADSIMNVRPGRRSAMYRIWRDGASADLLASDRPGSERGRWLRGLGSYSPPDPNRFRYATIGEHRYEFRGAWTLRAVGSGEVYNVAVADSIHYALHEIEELRNTLLVITGCAVVVTLAFAVLGIRRALRPIGQVAKHLDRVTFRHMDAEALQEFPAPAELQPFVKSTAGMLERLRKAFESQKRFAADASHELRTPLAVAKSTLQAAIMRSSSPAELKQAIDEVLDDLNRMQRVIDQLLVLARLGRPPGDEDDAEEISAGDLLAEVAERYDAMAAKAGGKVVVADTPELTLTGHNAELQRLLGNLVENAIVHGPRAGTVTVGAQAANGAVVIEVHDEGGTIPAEALPHLFDRFYRVDPSRSRETGGTGLGLAIAREIALRHGGDIRVESSPQRGTSVFVRLPLRSAGRS